MRNAKEYLKSYSDYFWQYEDGGKVIAIPNAYTIGYSEKIVFDFVKFIGPQGLPPFGSLLIAIAATNSNGAKSIDMLQNLVKDKESDYYEIKEGIKFAKLLTTIPVKYKKGNLRIELLRSLFRNCHNSIGIKKSSFILNDLAINSYSNSLFINENNNISNSQIVRDFKTLALIGRVTNSVELILQQLSNLPPEIEYDQLIEEELKSTNEGDNLVTDLIDHNETFHIGSLVQSIWSGLNIPFHSYIPSPQPMGGVADITNKGNFDKLLISEFAYEDDVLMSRLANNESLYHHREVPPSDNNFQRIILIDNTLKNWGTIRSIAYAIMVAITNHPKNKSTCSVYLIGNTFTKIEFQTLHQIIESFGILDPSLDPGIGLHQYFKEHKNSKSELFFICNQDSLEQPNMLRLNSDFSESIRYWIHPSIEGSISLFKNSKSGKKFIKKIEIPLKKLWGRKTNSKNLKESTHAYNSQYPILFPHHRMKSFWQEDHHLLAVSKQNSLLKFFDYQGNMHSSGWEMINNEKIDPYNLLGVVVSDDNLISALIKTTNFEYYIIFSSNKEKMKIHTPEEWWHSAKVQVENDNFYITKGDQTTIINLKGEVSSINQYRPPFKIIKNTANNNRAKQVFKNVTSISITENNLLRLNKHDLCLFNTRIQLKTYHNLNNPNKISSSNTEDGVFTFDDGSCIVHNKTGMLTLISSDENFPMIYIPSVLNTDLGVAIDSTFAGNEYFRKRQQINLRLMQPIPSPLNAVKITKNILGIDLKDAKQMIDQKLIKNIPAEKVERLKSDLNELEIKSKILPIGLSQFKISDKEFYDTYIKIFIDKILAHGN